ncbi:MAG: hypothetical protein AB2556_24095 [Candidatus Thiodiazotropha sp.]
MAQLAALLPLLLQNGSKLLARLLCVGSAWACGRAITVFVKLGLFLLLCKNNGKLLACLLCVGSGFHGFDLGFCGLGLG